MFSYFWLPNIERYFKHWASCLRRKTQARWPEEENQGSPMCYPWQRGKISIDMWTRPRKGLWVFYGLKSDNQSRRKDILPFYLYWNQLLYISRRKSAKLIMYVFCSFHCAARRACDAWALVFAPRCGKQNATLIADAFQATHNTLVRLTWPPSFSATKFSCGDCQHT